jgi:hypothetical protein
VFKLSEVRTLVKCLKTNQFGSELLSLTEPFSIFNMLNSVVLSTLASGLLFNPHALCFRLVLNFLFLWTLMELYLVLDWLKKPYFIRLFLCLT